MPVCGKWYCRNKASIAGFGTGELIQTDGSQHHWFENRGAKSTLLACIDDATSQIMHAAFVPSESTLDYMRKTKSYVARYGRPTLFAQGD